MQESTLYSMLGEGVTGKAKFQWIKTFGPGNVFAGKEDGEPLIIDRDFIARAFRDSQAQQRTTEDLANIMIYSYFRWSMKPENAWINGIIAEEIHNRVMLSIAKYWKRRWAPEKHKVPMYGIWNLFNIIKRFVQSDFLPVQGVVKSRLAKCKANVALLRSTCCASSLCELGVTEKPSKGYGPPMDIANIFIDRSSEISEWNSFNPETPFDVLIFKEMEHCNEV